MGRLRFSDTFQTHVVPRLDNDMIDELFYQEDEIGEMRHTAFMIECGLEEDPPDGPDVPPVPWGDMLVEAHRGRKSTPGSMPSSPSTAESQPRRRLQRTMPERSRSTDDIDLLEEELSPKSNRRKLVAAKSGSLHAMRPQTTIKRKPPPRCHSVDDSNAIDLNLSFAKTEGSPPGRRAGRKLVAAKSGSLHGMREAAAKAVGRKDEDRGSNGDACMNPTPPAPVRRLVAAKSGTPPHGIRESNKSGRKDEDRVSNGDACMNSTPPSPVRRLVAAKSGTPPHGIRESNKSGRKDEDRVSNGDACMNPTPPSSVRRLVAAKSGTPPHGIRESNKSAKSVEPNGSRPPRPIPSARGLGARTKSGTNHVVGGSSNGTTTSVAQVNRIVYKNGVKTVVTEKSSTSHGDLPPRLTLRRGSSTTNSASSTETPSVLERRRHSLPSQRSIGGYSSESDDDFLSELVVDSDGFENSGISISTDASDSDNPLSQPKKSFRKQPIACSSPPENTSKKSVSMATQKPPSSKTKTKKSLSVGKEKKKKAASVYDSSGSDLPIISPSKRRVQGSRKVLPNGTTKSELAGSEPVVESALSRLRNGSSTPSQLLQNMQCSSSPSPSPLKLNKANNGIKKLRSKSVGGLDIPPAFRGL